MPINYGDYSHKGRSLQQHEIKAAKQEICKNLAVGLAAAVGIGAIIAISHFCHLPPVGLEVGIPGIVVAAILMRLAVTKSGMSLLKNRIKKEDVGLATFGLNSKTRSFSPDLGRASLVAATHYGLSEENRYALALERGEQGDATLFTEIDDYRLSEELRTNALLLLFKHCPELCRELNPRSVPNGELRLALAKACGYKGYPVYNHLSQIDLDQEQRYQLAHALILNTPHQIADVIDLFDLTDSQKVELALELDEDPHMEVPDYIEHLLPDDRDQRYQVILALCKHYPEEVGRDMFSYDLAQSQELEIARLLANDPRAHLPLWIGRFALDLEARKEIALIVAKRNPAELFENLDSFRFENIDFLKGCLDPYFELKPLLLEFASGNHALFEEILQRVQEITKTAPLPKTFSDAISETIEQDITSFTQSQILNWVRLINANPSAITYDLIHRIHLAILPVFPQLRAYFYIEQGQTKLRGEGFDVVAKKCELDPGVKIYHTVYVRDLAYALWDFQRDPTIQKGAFPISFGPNLNAHYCPLYVEKTDASKLRIFISDSVGIEDIQGDFPFMIMEEIRDLPIEDLYVLEPRRQYSTAVCSIFTLSDLLEILKFDDIFAVLNREGSCTEDSFLNMPYRRVKTPPAGMMKMTQSMTKVKRFATTTGNTLIRAASIAVLEHDEMQLTDFVDQVSPYEKVRGDAKQQNKFAFWSLGHIFVMILFEVAQQT